MKLLVIDPFPEHFVEELKSLPFKVQYTPDADRADVLQHIFDANILLINSKLNVNLALLDAAPKLRLIIRAGVGMDHRQRWHLAFAL